MAKIVRSTGIKQLDPIPAGARLKKPHSKYKLHKLEIGDTVIVPLPKSWQNKEKVKNRIRCAIGGFRKAHPQYKFATAELKNGTFAIERLPID